MKDQSFYKGIKENVSWHINVDCKDFPENEFIKDFFSLAHSSHNLHLTPLQSNLTHDGMSGGTLQMIMLKYIRMCSISYITMSIYCDLINHKACAVDPQQ